MRYLAAAIAQGDILTPHSTKQERSRPARKSLLARMVGR